MKRYILKQLSVIILSVISNQLSAQNGGNLTQIGHSLQTSASNNTDWVRFKPNLKIKAEDIFTNYDLGFRIFGLRNEIDKMVLIKSETDKLSYTHLKYQQYYKNVPVEGAQYMIHSYWQPGTSYQQPETGNGHIVKGLNINTTPSISSKEAVEKAIKYVSSEFQVSSFKWEEKPVNSYQLPATSYNLYYPKPELVIADKKFGKDATNYRLVYKMVVYAAIPLKRLQIYIDAMTGEIYHSFNILYDDNKPGTAATIYDGTQSIMVDSLSTGSFILNETTRGSGIHTFSLNNGTDYSAATDITSATSLFNADKVANEAHWGAEKTYDFYLQKFGRNSYDDAGAPLNSYVHYGNNYLNAFWDGTEMTYGDGGTGGYGPFTELDVCGHEITHAVTGATAGLIYQNESGALDESFSDIMGTSIEFFASSKPNWLIGEYIIKGGFRSMSDPKSLKQPNTYHGQYWSFATTDNGGVHQNNSIGNYWFYLLSAGGTGTNDNGYHYTIKGIGLDSAERVAYRTLTYYLTPNSDYLDTYYASVQAATDLYGHCSLAVKQDALAWYAAGVGYPLSDSDIYLANILSPVTSCGLNNEKVSLNLYYAGCDSILHPGEKVVLAYKMDANAPVYDTLILSANLKGGDSLKFTFKSTANVSKIGTHTLSCWGKLGATGSKWNDSITGYQFTNILKQNIDVGVTKALSPVSGCGLTSQEPVSCKFTFYGCDSIKAGDTIALSYKINNNAPVIENYVLTSRMYPHDTLTYTFSTKADLSNIFGIINFQVRTQYFLDTFNLNDAVSFTINHPVSLQEDTITFDEKNVSDLFYVTTAQYSHALVSAEARHTGKNGFLMTGGNATKYINILKFPDSTNTWQINEFLSAKISFCVDATSWKHANMRFDLKQTDGGAIYTMILGAGDYTRASNMRILANNTQIGGTYNPLTDSQDPWKTRYVNLDSYANSKFNLTFESRCISKDTVYSGMPLQMDNVFIDNVCFSELSQIGINNYRLPAFSCQLYPTISENWYFIDMESDSYQDIRFETLDLLGKILKTTKQKAFAGKNKFVFSSSDLNKGIYLIRLTGISNTLTLRMVKL